jgi:hypothetical protein
MRTPIQELRLVESGMGDGRMTGMCLLSLRTTSLQTLRAYGVHSVIHTPSDSPTEM